ICGRAEWLQIVQRVPVRLFNLTMGWLRCCSRWLLLGRRPAPKNSPLRTGSFRLSRRAMRIDGSVKFGTATFVDSRTRNVGKRSEAGANSGAAQKRQARQLSVRFYYWSGRAIVIECGALPREGPVDQARRGDAR